MSPFASGQHKTSHRLPFGLCCSMYCSRRWSNTLLNLPCIWVTAYPGFVYLSWFWDQVNLSFLLIRVLNFISIWCFLLGALFSMSLSVFTWSRPVCYNNNKSLASEFNAHNNFQSFEIVILCWSNVTFIRQKYISTNATK